MQILKSIYYIGNLYRFDHFMKKKKNYLIQNTSLLVGTFLKKICIRNKQSIHLIHNQFM